MQRIKISVSNTQTRLHRTIVEKSRTKHYTTSLTQIPFILTQKKKVKQRKTHPIFPHLAPYKMHNDPETGPPDLTHFPRGQGLERNPVER